jgi:hypothetical protein
MLIIVGLIFVALCCLFGWFVGEWDRIEADPEVQKSIEEEKKIRERREEWLKKAKK